MASSGMTKRSDGIIAHHNGEARALDVLAHTFETLPLRDGETPLVNHVLRQLKN